MESTWTYPLPPVFLQSLQFMCFFNYFPTDGTVPLSKIPLQEKNKLKTTLITAESPKRS